MIASSSAPYPARVLQLADEGIVINAVKSGRQIKNNQHRLPTNVEGLKNVVRHSEHCRFD
jgi:hypothetical protein